MQFSSYSSKEISNLFIRSSLYISFFSLFIQYFFSIITYSIYDQRKEWVFYGTSYQYQEVLNEIDGFKNDINLSIIDEKESLDNLDISKIKGIVIGNLVNIKNNLDIIFIFKVKRCTS